MSSGEVSRYRKERETQRSNMSMWIVRRMLLWKTFTVLVLCFLRFFAAD